MPTAVLKSHALHSKGPCFPANHGLAHALFALIEPISNTETRKRTDENQTLIHQSILFSVTLLLKIFPDAFPFSLLEDGMQCPFPCMEQHEQSPCPNQKEFISIWVLVLQQSNPIGCGCQLLSSVCAPLALFPSLLIILGV